MQRVSSGYTVVEVMIFLAVSAFLLVISFTFLSGTEGHNRFSQSMRDMQSKVQDWINDVPTGFAGGQTNPTSLNCTLAGGGTPIQPKRPLINQNGGGNNKPNCIFLGKVIQFTDSSTPNSGQDSQVYAYSVFGVRSIQPSGQEERPVASLAEADPVAAVGIQSYSGSADLTDTYTINGGAKVKKIVKSSGVSSDTSHLAGFFLSFNQLSGTSSGSTSVVAYQYPIGGNQNPGDPSSGGATKVDNCINLDPNPGGGDNCSSLPNLTDWEICFYNDSNSDMAVLTISSASGLGATTKLEFKGC